jgi:hypothetical protein
LCGSGAPGVFLLVSSLSQPVCVGVVFPLVVLCHWIGSAHVTRQGVQVLILFSHLSQLGLSCSIGSSTLVFFLGRRSQHQPSWSRQQFSFGPLVLASFSPSRIRPVSYLQALPGFGLLVFFFCAVCAARLRPSGRFASVFEADAGLHAAD